MAPRGLSCGRSAYWKLDPHCHFRLRLAGYHGKRTRHQSLTCESQPMPCSWLNSGDASLRDINVLVCLLSMVSLWATLILAITSDVFALEDPTWAVISPGHIEAHKPLHRTVAVQGGQHPCWTYFATLWKTVEEISILNGATLTSNNPPLTWSNKKVTPKNGPAVHSFVVNFDANTICCKGTDR